MSTTELDIPNLRVVVRDPALIVDRSRLPIQSVSEFSLTASYAQYAKTIDTEILGLVGNLSASGDVTASTLYVATTLDVDGSVTISQSLEATSITASNFSGSFQGDGSQLTEITATYLDIDTFGADLTSQVLSGNTQLIASDGGTDGRIVVSQLATPLVGYGLEVDNGTIRIAQSGIGDGLTGGSGTQFSLDGTSQYFIDSARNAITVTNTTGPDGITFIYTGGDISATLYTSSISINGTEVSLGNSIVITANTPQSLSFSDGLTGSVFDGSTSSIVTLNTASAHFLTGIKQKLNTDAVVSSSAQVNYTQLQNIPLNIISSSTQFNNVLDPFSGSFTGTFYGDGTFVTNVSASSVNFVNITNKPSLVSSSIQVDHNTTTNYTASEHINHGNVSIVAGLGLNGGGNITTTRTLNLDTSSIHFLTGIKEKLNTDGVVSSSSQVTYLQLNAIPSGIVSSSAQAIDWNVASSSVAISASYAVSASYAPTILPSGTVSSSQQINVLDTTHIQTLATTGSNTFVGTQIVSGSMYILNNLIVQGSSSLEFITASAVTLGTNIIYLNADTPAIRYGGISVFDSGSTQQTASILWDSLSDNWIFTHQEIGNPLDSSIFLFGPLSQNGLGSEQDLPANYIVRVEDNGPNHGHHLTTSSIYDNGLTVSIRNNTEISGSLLVLGTISGSLILPQNIVSSSTQVINFLPIGVVSSSTQAVDWTVASASVAVSASHAPTILPNGIVSSSTQIDHDSTTNFVSTEHIDHSSISIIAGDGLSGGGFITASTTVMLNTASAHFTSGIKQKLNTDGVISSSAQVVYTQLQSIPSGIISSSAQFRSLTSPFTGSFTGSLTGSVYGTSSFSVSSSFAVSASWAPGMGGGTAIAVQDEGTLILATPISFNFTGAGVSVSATGNTASISIPGGAGTELTGSVTGSFNGKATGSFTGSFSGNGYNLTNLPGGTDEKGPAFTYSSSVLTQITYDSGNYKLFTYSGSLLTQSIFIQGPKTITKTFYYNIDNTLASITQLET